MNKVQVEIVDPGLEMVKRIELVFLFLPVKTMSPVRAEILQPGHIGTVFPTAVGYLIGPSGSSQAFAQVFNDKGGDEDGIRLDAHSCRFPKRSKNRTTAKKAENELFSILSSGYSFPLRNPLFCNSGMGRRAG